MTLIFNSIIADQYTPSNFKASYTFYTGTNIISFSTFIIDLHVKMDYIFLLILEFGIQGTRVYQNKTCLYTYNNENVIQGSLNSPRYPQNYPLNLKCDYIFDIASSKNERVLFNFKDFRIPGTPNQ